MYIWNIKGLRHQLKTNSISERDIAHHTIFFFIWLAFLTFYASGLGLLDEGTKLILFIYAFIILTSGLRLIQRLIARRDNKDIINRFICLFTPISIRIATLLIIIRFFVLVSMMIWEIQFTQEDLWGMASLETIVVGTPMLFLLMYYHIDKLTAPTKKN